MSENHETPLSPPPPPAAGNRFVQGFRFALGVVLLLPFIVFLFPMWFVYRWNEVRQGHPEPEAPWSDLFNRDKKPAPLHPHRQTAHHPEHETVVFTRPQPVAPQGHGVAVVTGGGHRLGAVLCQELASWGYTVAVVCHHAVESGAGVVDAIRGQGAAAELFTADLRHPVALEQLLHEVEERLGPISVLVNNAAIFSPSPVHEPHWDEIGALLTVNLQGPMMLAMLAGRRMREQGGGQIIQIGDLWAERPLKNHAAYCASKAGVTAAMQVLARDLAPAVKVNVIAPGAVLPPEDPRELEGYQRLLDNTPLAREAGVDGVVGVVRYLLTTPFVTGSVIHVDGGR